MAVSQSISGGGGGSGDATSLATFSTTENQRTYSQSTTGIDAGNVTIQRVIYDTSGTVLADDEWTTNGSDFKLNFDPRADGLPVSIDYKS